MRKLVVAILGSLLLATQISGCASTKPHALPLSYRTAIYDSPKEATVGACRQALVETGYEIAYADSVSGLVSTKHLYTKRFSDEIGGTARTQYVLMVVESEGGSMVTAELVLEKGGASGWVPATMSVEAARSAYRDLFVFVKKYLDANQSPG